MSALATRLLFYPTLLYNVILSRGLKVRHWFDEVDDGVILGALPFPWDIPKLHALGVRAVVNTCIEYRGPLAAYAQHGIAELYIPTVDFTPPRLQDIDAAVEFMGGFIARGDKVYVHCKAGRGRSATVVLCWLVRARGMTPEAAYAVLLAKRPHVNRGLAKRAVVQSFAARERPADGADRDAFRLQ